MMPRGLFDKASGAAWGGNHRLPLPSRWRARIPHAEHRLGGDPSARHSNAKARKIDGPNRNLSEKLTTLDVWLTPKGLRQGCTLWLQASATYLCTLEQPEAFYKLTLILRWAFLPLRWRA